jgi:YD repeat-containing protein
MFYRALLSTRYYGSFAYSANNFRKASVLANSQKALAWATSGGLHRDPHHRTTHGSSELMRTKTFNVARQGYDLSLLSKLQGNKRLYCSGDVNSSEEESDDYIDDEDGNSTTPMPKPLEDLTFQAYTVKELDEMERDGDLKLQPSYQRKFKWTQNQASLFIESVLRKYPSVPEIILLTSKNEDGEQTSVVFDGQQRLTSILFYLRNIRGDGWHESKGDKDFRLEQLQLLKDLEGKRYQDLPKLQQNKIKNYYVRCATIPSSWQMADYIDFFKRIQGGGTPMTPQELRRALSRGPFTDLLDELSQNDIVLKALEGLLPLYPPKSDKLQELLLRYFQYQLFQEKFNKPSINQNALVTMNHFNREMGSWTDDGLCKREQLPQPLLRSLKLITHVFGHKEAFRLPQALMKNNKPVENGSIKKVWIDEAKLKPPLWDCMILTFARPKINESQQKIRENAGNIRTKLIDLMQTHRLFTDSLRSSGADISSRVSLLEKHILDIIDSSSMTSASRDSSPQRRKELIRTAREQNVPCKLCQQPLSPFDEHLHIDHIVPISTGGTNDLSNLQVVHKTCNLKKSNKLSVTKKKQV